MLLAFSKSPLFIFFIFYWDLSSYKVVDNWDMFSFKGLSIFKLYATVLSVYDKAMFWRVVEKLIWVLLNLELYSNLDIFPGSMDNCPFFYFPFSSIITPKSGSILSKLDPIGSITFDQCFTFFKAFLRSFPFCK